MLKNKNYPSQNNEEESNKTPKSPLKFVRYLIYAAILIILLAAISYKTLPLASSDTPPQQENATLLLMQELAQDPNNPKRLMAAGQEFMAQHNLPSAIELFEKAKQLQPDNAEVLYNLGSAQLQNNDAAAAEVNLNAALALQGDEQTTNQIRYALALLYMEKQPLKAREYLKEIAQGQKTSSELKQAATELLRNLEYIDLD